MNLCHIKNKNILRLVLSSIIIISICSDRVIADEQVNITLTNIIINLINHQLQLHNFIKEKNTHST